MGLTVNNQAKSLTEELGKLKEELETKLEEIDQQLKLLKDTVFYAELLDDAPTTWEGVREKRNMLLRKSDWTMITGVTVPQREWSLYRQILRDIPQTYKDLDPELIQWPVEPSSEGPNTTPVE